VSEQANIDELISKYFSGEASPEEAMRLDDWKNLNEENHLYFLQVERIFSASVHKTDIGHAWDKVSSKIIFSEVTIPIRPFTSFLRIAASVVLLIGLGTAIMYWLSSSSRTDVTLYATNAETKKITLPDGSNVTISPNSSLRADNDFGKKERTLHLKGSAYFSVVHDAKIPFVVNAGGVFIKDIGTRFFIRTSPDTDTVHVHVDEGVVLLFDDKNANIEIKAGGNTLYVKSSKQLISEPTKAESVSINFSNNTLAQVVSKLNIAYNTNIEIGNPALNSCTITTQFNNEKLETILSVIAETLGITYEKTSKGYILKGENCHP
jgi:transmembrane sensor